MADYEISLISDHFCGWGVRSMNEYMKKKKGNHVAISWNHFCEMKKKM